MRSNRAVSAASLLISRPISVADEVGSSTMRAMRSATSGSVARSLIFAASPSGVRSTLFTSGLLPGPESTQHGIELRGGLLHVVDGHVVSKVIVRCVNTLQRRFRFGQVLLYGLLYGEDVLFGRR